MCGIIGMISKQYNPLLKNLFEEKSKEILDRGIVFDTVFSRNSYLGCCRLPTDGGNDSAFNSIQSQERLRFLYNGIITNVDDLYETYNLSEKAKQFDTRCLFEGFSVYGKKFLSNCRGMFAFAYITEKEIILVRDTVGIKPLYFENSNNAFAFASEIKALPGLGEVKEVLPGEIITYNKSTGTVVAEKFEYTSYKNYEKHELYDCLKESIINPTKRYLVQSKKDIALLLSGGLDSSLIAKTLMNGLSQPEKNRIITFCLGEKDSSDMKIAVQLANDLGLRLITVRPYSYQAAIKKLPEIVYTVESPYARVIKVAILQHALADAIKKFDIDIVISGEGADELFFGYKRFIDGLLPHQSEKLFSLFYSKVFYYSLLQRFERIFARSQIEGRVPFLDQELIQLSKKFSPHEKVRYSTNSYSLKVPLRNITREIDLPAYIYQREKEKMTTGVTGKENEEKSDGYLEEEAYILTGKTFGQLVKKHYSKFFPTAPTKDSIQEEDLMELAATYRNQNYSSMKGVVG